MQEVRVDTKRNWIEKPFDGVLTNKSGFSHFRKDDANRRIGLIGWTATTEEVLMLIGQLQNMVDDNGWWQQISWAMGNYITLH